MKLGSRLYLVTWPNYVITRYTDYTTVMSIIKSLDSKFGINHWFPCLKPLSQSWNNLCSCIDISGFLVNSEKLVYFCIWKILKILFPSNWHLRFRERVNGFGKCIVFSSISCSCHPIHIEFWGFPEECESEHFHSPSHL